MTRRKDGRWQERVVIHADGRQITKYFYGKTKAEVNAKIHAYKVETERGRPFAEVADEWWTIAYDDIEHNTAKSYRAPYNRAKLYFGDTPIKEIRPVDIRRFLTEFVRETAPADKTCRTQLMIVNLICKHALNCGDIDSNPATGITVPKHLPKNLRDMPTDDDLQRVKDSVNCTFGLFAFFALYTGCRKGELLALEWDDIDLFDRSIEITKSVYFVSNNPHIKQPKTLAGFRTVPIPNKLYEQIKGHKGRGLVFPGPTGRLITNGQFNRLWNAYKAESGVTATPHQLRHAYATMLFEADISAKDAQELLGHSQLSTTEDIYTHIRDQRKERIKAALLDVDIA